MYKYLQVGRFAIPSYSVMIIWGLLVCNLIAQRDGRIERKNYENFLLLEFFGGIGAVLGAKIIDFVNLAMRDGAQALSWINFKSAGYSYYGGLAGFFIVSNFICKSKKLDKQELSRDYLYLLPLLHAFWKVGCLLGGCCFGIKYNGSLSIVYPTDINIVSGISVFPSPIIEAIISSLICLLLLIAKKRCWKVDFCGLFFILYGTTRFFLEYFRYHETSSIPFNGQVNSLICGGIGLILCIRMFRSRIVDE